MVEFVLFPGCFVGLGIARSTGICDNKDEEGAECYYTSNEFENKAVAISVIVALVLTIVINWLIMNTTRESGNKPNSPPKTPKVHIKKQSNRVTPSIETKPKPLPAPKPLPTPKPRPLVKTRSVPDIESKTLEKQKQEITPQKTKTPHESVIILRAGKISRRVSEFEMKANRDFASDEKTNQNGAGKHLLRRIFLAHSAARIMRGMTFLKEQRQNDVRSPPPTYEDVIKTDGRSGTEERETDVNPYWLPAYSSEDPVHHAVPDDVYHTTAYPDSEIHVTQPQSVTRTHSTWHKHLR